MSENKTEIIISDDLAEKDKLEKTIMRLREHPGEFVLLDEHMCGYFIPYTKAATKEGKERPLRFNEALDHIKALLRDDIIAQKLPENISYDEKRLCFNDMIISNTPMYLRRNSGHLLIVLSMIHCMYVGNFDKEAHKWVNKEIDPDTCFFLMNEYWKIIDPMLITESFCIKVMNAAPECFSQFPSEMQSDPDFNVRLAACCDHALDNMYIIEKSKYFNKFSEDKKRFIYRIALQNEKNPNAIYKFFKNSKYSCYWSDRQFCIEAARVNERVYSYVDESLRKDNSFALEIIKANPLLYCKNHLGIELFNDSDFSEKANECNPLCENVSQILSKDKKDKNVCKRYIEQLCEQVGEMPYLVLSILRIYKSIKGEYLKSLQAAELVKKNGEAAYYLSADSYALGFNNSINHIVDLCSADPSCFRFVDSHLRQDRHLIADIAKKNIGILEYFPDELKCDHDFIEGIIRENPEAAKYIDGTYPSGKLLLEKCAEENHEVLKFISDEDRREAERFLGTDNPRNVLITFISCLRGRGTINPEEYKTGVINGENPNISVMSSQTNETVIKYLMKYLCRNDSCLDAVYCIVTNEARNCFVNDKGDIVNGDEITVTDSEGKTSTQIVSAFTYLSQIGCQPEGDEKRPEFIDITASDGNRLRSSTEIACEILNKLNASDNVYIDITGGFRNSMDTVKLLTKLLDYRHMKTRVSFYVDYGSHLITDTSEYDRSLEITEAAREFINTGNAHELQRVLRSVKCSKSVGDVLGYMVELSDEIDMCRLSKIGEKLTGLYMAIEKLENHSDSNEEGSGETANDQSVFLSELIMKQLIPTVKETFFRERTDPDYKSIIRWCLGNRMTQQALTIFCEYAPYTIVKNLIMNYPDYMKKDSDEFSYETAGDVLDRILTRGSVSYINEYSGAEERWVYLLQTACQNAFSGVPNEVSPVYSFVTDENGDVSEIETKMHDAIAAMYDLLSFLSSNRERLGSSVDTSDDEAVTIVVTISLLISEYLEKRESEKKINSCDRAAAAYVNSFVMRDGSVMSLDELRANAVNENKWRFNRFYTDYLGISDPPFRMLRSAIMFRNSNSGVAFVRNVPDTVIRNVLIDYVYVKRNRNNINHAFVFTGKDDAFSAVSSFYGDLEPNYDNSINVITENISRALNRLEYIEYICSRE